MHFFNVNAHMRSYVQASGPGYCSFALTSASQDCGVSEKDLPADLGGVWEGWCATVRVGGGRGEGGLGVGGGKAKEEEE